MYGRLISLWIVAALAACSASQADAQLRDLNSTKDGSGTLRYAPRSSSSDVSRVQVILRSNGDAEIRATSGARETFSGRWSNNGNRSCRITIDRVGRDSAIGGGYVDHDGRGSFTKIDLSGGVKGARFEFKFSTSRGGDLSPISSTRTGRGTLRFSSGAPISNISRVSVSLGRAGEFEVRALSGADEIWRGRWHRDGNRRAGLDLDSIGGSSTGGIGYVDLDGSGSFDWVYLNGTNGTLGYTLDFRSGDGTPPPGAAGSVTEAAHGAVRREMERRFGRGANVRITTTSERFLSASERRVTGRGRYSRRPGDEDRDFDYSVKVKLETLGTRDVEVRPK